MSGPTRSLTAHQLSQIDKTDSCWVWTGTLDSQNYGKTSYTSAHAAVYQALVGPVPAGYELDHRCHNDDKSCAGGRSCRHRRCVNPDHLEVVTHAENVRRRYEDQTACHLGHEFTPANTYTGRGARQCRACQRMAVARYQARKRLRLAAAS